MRNALKRPSLLVQVLIGALAGILMGYFFPAIGSRMEILGSLFLNLIQMVIVPLIFPLVVLAIVDIKDAKRFGGVAVKGFLFFFLVTTVLIFLGLVTGRLTGIGQAVQAGTAGTEAIEGVASNINFVDFFLSIVPNNVVSAMASGDLLPVLFFGVLLGFALVAIGDTGQPVVDVLRSWSKAMYKIVDYSIAFAPIGVFGVLASDMAEGGLGQLVSLGQFVLLLFGLYLGAVVVVFPIIAALFGVPYMELLKHIKGPAFLAFTTGSSSVVMPTLIERLEKFGVPSSIASFVVPLGYSFNLTGACLYVSLSVMFVANLYGSPMSWGQILTLVVFLTVITKGIAAVPSGALVVLLAVAGQLGLPAEGVALLVSVDFFANAGRTAVNVVGNALAPAVVAKSEGVNFSKTAQRSVTKA
ncbi:dicarboxylate/amino acid:cation symporter [Atopococcus tabaci]|uniref:dicarboxylate/amino acid:cation symporter n=1 Tax=Atopococcus tabaci TaxID=269774 RepID=UPI002409046E|nr:dicarboxylate/amino acid:cation symporter [Atopococcus tabaci]